MSSSDNDTNKHQSLEWPQSSQFKKSIKLEFSLYISGIIVILMLVTGYVITNQYVKTVTQNVIEKLLVQARSYSGPAGKLIISTNEPDELLLNNICRKLTEDNPEIYWAGITDKKNTFIAHTDIKQVIASKKMKPVEKNQPGLTLRNGETFGLQNDTIYITVPIKENDILLGKLIVASSNAPILSARDTSIKTVASITIVVIFIGLPLTMMVLHRKLRPISVITDTLKKIDVENIDLDIPISTRNEFGYLADTLHVMGSKLKSAQEDLVEKERFERELEIAHEIQVNILPRKYPKTPHFEFAGTYRSAREVGGDYYDFIDIDENNLGVLIADVSGKSLPGMLVMLLTRDMVLQHARTIIHPAELLSEVNRELLLNIKRNMFVTMFYGILNKTTGNFTFASAGHNPLIWLNGKTEKAELIKTRGYPLGMIPPSPFSKRIETGNIHLSDGDLLVQFTDGINEARNPAGDEFGMDRFIEVLKSHKAYTPKELAEVTMKRLDDFVGSSMQFDDITLLILKWELAEVDTINSTSHRGVYAN